MSKLDDWKVPREVRDHPKPKQPSFFELLAKRLQQKKEQVTSVDVLLAILEIAKQFDKNFTCVPISCNTSGDNQIVPAFQGRRIKVYAIAINFAGTVSAKWRSDTTDLTGALSFQAREGYTINVQPPAFILETEVGEALNLNLSATVYAYGWLCYWDDDSI